MTTLDLRDPHARPAGNLVQLRFVVFSFACLASRSFHISSGSLWAAEIWAPMQSPSRWTSTFCSTFMLQGKPRLCFGGVCERGRRCCRLAGV